MFVGVASDVASVINPANYALLQAGGGTLAVTSVSYDAATRTATLTPSSPLAEGTSYTATVRGGATDPRVIDAEGTAMSANYSWTFSTATATSGSWSNA